MKLRNLRSVALGVSAAALLSMSGQAMAGGYDDTWYAGLGAGWAWPDELAYTTSDAEDDRYIYGKVGTNVTENWRGELEISHREHDIDGGAAATSLSGEASVLALMFNLVRDFKSNADGAGSITPYIGAGAGGAIVSTDGLGPVYTVDEEEVVLAGQILAGVNFAVTDNVDLEVGYKYFDTLGADIDNTIDTREESFQAHIATLGLRWTFGEAEEEYVAPPAPEPVPEPKEFNYKIYFPFDDYNLTAEANETVKEIADEYKDEQVVRILVQGNTDTSGSNSYNDRLSSARADSVRAGLIANGIPADLIVTEALGETNPAVETGDGIKEPLNRRAEVMVTLE